MREDKVHEQAELEGNAVRVADQDQALEANEIIAQADKELAD